MGFENDRSWICFWWKRSQVYLIQGSMKKKSTSLSFLAKTLMFFSIFGKLRCRVDVNFKPLFKTWICDGVKLTLDKLKTLVWIISSFFGLLLLYTGHGEKNYLLRTYLNFLQLILERLAYFAVMICSRCWSLLLISLS